MYSEWHSHNLTTPWRLLAFMGVRSQATPITQYASDRETLASPSPLPSKGKMENGKLTLEWAEADNPPHISPRANHVGRAVG